MLDEADRSFNFRIELTAIKSRFNVHYYFSSAVLVLLSRCRSNRLLIRCSRTGGSVCGG